MTPDNATIMYGWGGGQADWSFLLISSSSCSYVGYYLSFLHEDLLQACHRTEGPAAYENMTENANLIIIFITLGLILIFISLVIVVHWLLSNKDMSKYINLPNGGKKETRTKLNSLPSKATSVGSTHYFEQMINGYDCIRLSDFSQDSTDSRDDRSQGTRAWLFGSMCANCGSIKTEIPGLPTEECSVQVDDILDLLDVIRLLPVSTSAAQYKTEVASESQHQGAPANEGSENIVMPRSPIKVTE